MSSNRVPHIKCSRPMIKDSMFLPHGNMKVHNKYHVDIQMYINEELIAGCGNWLCLPFRCPAMI